MASFSGGNVPSLSGDYDYEDVQARALNEHGAGVLEALNRIYEVPVLLGEQVTGKR